jgi:hypothetical protein
MVWALGHTFKETAKPNMLLRQAIIYVVRGGGV